MKYAILREQPNPAYVEGESDPAERTIFAPAGDADFDEAADANYTVQNHIEDLQAMFGVCFAAKALD